MVKRRRRDGVRRTQKTVYVDAELLITIDEENLDINVSEAAEAGIRKAVEETSEEDIAIKMRREIEEKREKKKELEEEVEGLESEFKKKFDMTLDDYFEENNPQGTKEKKIERFLDHLTSGTSKSKWLEQVPNNGDKVEVEKPPNGNIEKMAFERYSYFVADIYEVVLRDRYGLTRDRAKNFVKEALRYYRDGHYGDN